MIVRIPLDTTGLTDYQFEITLEGADYIMRFYWRDRDTSWYLDLSGSDGTPLALGRRVILGTDLIGRSADPALPPGVMVGIDSTNSDQDPGLTDLGTRVNLMYLELASFIEALTT